jgi:hypothetical protein
MKKLKTIYNKTQGYKTYFFIAIAVIGTLGQMYFKDISITDGLQQLFLEFGGLSLRASIK